MPVTLSWTLDNAKAARVVAAFCAAYGYQTEIDGAPNPETPQQFTKRMIGEYMRSTVVAYEKKQRVDAAASQAGEPLEV